MRSAVYITLERMKTWRLIFVAVAVLGLACGPAVLRAAGEARPPIRWNDIPFAVFGSFVGGLLVIGMQLFRSDPRPSQWAIRLFGPASVWMLASGVSAAIFALATTGLVPHALLFLGVGFGLLLGVFICHAIHMRKFRHAL